ncbi:altered inheritance-mitochondria protein 31 [Gaeumannomyces tritici R3-111a-1]|uniref:Altered inheritance-mitochondria protein 31 n=1 Tax=Gaeumannomyces tritici (strain R3-111a-1) TaxID=644352 RepID=J3NI04_GAET3|nr:altered inheritance-mitochondria protein 31 [Gaeumannomyces tritici R3-111a-1]EJT80897.1 altered inheritance-mitochondria protein 31 [Gaeumannomyces tritici R3-111a-1]
MPNAPGEDRPLPSSFDEDPDFYNENAFQKISRKLKQQPLVPLGCILTVAAFTNAYRAMRRGDHSRMNRMFRYRVAAQGFTVLAMVFGGIYFNDQRHKEREVWKQKQEDEAEEKRLKWIRELEVRDQEDRAAKENMEQRRQRAAAVGAKRGAQAQAGAAESSASASTSSSWYTLDGWFWGSTKETAPAVDASEVKEKKPEKKMSLRSDDR